MPAKPMPVRSRVIEQNNKQPSRGRLTRLEPWSRSRLKKAYQQTGQEWDALEEASVKAQGQPDFND
jgi:hypothetical protein